MPGLYEYKVIPAPTKGKRAKGVKGNEGRFSVAISDVLNDMANQGWEFQRAETLPSVERVGLTKTETQHHNMLVFRRPHPDYVAPVSVAAPAVTPPTVPVHPAAPVPPAQDPIPEPIVAQTDTPRFSAPMHADTAPPSPPVTSSTPQGIDDADLPGILKDRGKHLRDS